jgi:hypothetical protein
VKNVIDEVYESLKIIPSSLKNNEKYLSENKIRDCIKKIYKQNNLYNDNYHKCHENRFILTLSEIPICKNKDENILEIGSFTYFAEFQNIYEYEIDHIFIGTYEGDIIPNLNEISDIKWIKICDIMSDLTKFPEKYTRWFITAFPFVIKYLSENQI